MGTDSPKPSLDDNQTQIRLAIKRSKYNKLLAKEAEAALLEVVMVVVDEEAMPEELKEAVRERYEAFGERREELVEKQIAECEQLVQGGDELL